MNTVIIDYGSGNLHSALKSFQRVANINNRGSVQVSDNPNVIKNADRIVLPGVGSFDDCMEGLLSKKDLMAILKKRVLGDGIPFLGICVGLQLLADLGHENKKNSPGLGWIGGQVKRIPSSPHNFRVPHMGWNSLVFDKQHELVKGLPRLIDMYFLHSYHLELNDKNYRVAHVSYSSQLTAIVAKGNISGSQFHPEKSQAAGQKFIENFLCWKP
ncbi:MAG: imidazole glycerol phosphate synthase subunit HisH [Rickettsiales bacterium]|jgi:glutamine amidotransferase|nr:imidazole glycerol phosphate synthase subunit HisH [Rickettsiales bacterium]